MQKYIRKIKFRLRKGNGTVIFGVFFSLICMMILLMFVDLGDVTQKILLGQSATDTITDGTAYYMATNKAPEADRATDFARDRAEMLKNSIDSELLAYYDLTSSSFAFNSSAVERNVIAIDASSRFLPLINGNFSQGLTQANSTSATRYTASFLEDYIFNTASYIDNNRHTQSVNDQNLEYQKTDMILDSLYAARYGSRRYSNIPYSGLYYILPQLGFTPVINSLQIDDINSLKIGDIIVSGNGVGVYMGEYSVATMVFDRQELEPLPDFLGGAEIPERPEGTYGDYGKLYVPSLGIDIALFNCPDGTDAQTMQEYTDREDGAPVMNWGDCPVITDHSDQNGYGNILNSTEGTLIFIYSGDSDVKAYLFSSKVENCRISDDGDVLYPDGSSIFEVNEESYSTSLSHGSSGGAPGISFPISEGSSSGLSTGSRDIIRLYAANPFNEEDYPHWDLIPEAGRRQIMEEAARSVTVLEFTDVTNLFTDRDVTYHYKVSGTDFVYSNDYYNGRVYRFGC